MLKDFFANILTKEPKIGNFPPGLYSYLAPASDPMNFRLHLRLEENGSGVLLVNASTVLHLNETAAEYAYFLVNNKPEDEIIDHFVKRYKTKSQIVSQDYKDFRDQINTLVSSPDLDPVTYLDFERIAPYQNEISSPYRLDFAITYKVDGESSGGSSPHKRVDRELSTDEFKALIDTAWENGIPHIIFTGGEPTLRDDLPALLEHAENNGQVTGLITNGKKLSDPTYLNSLLQAGLDHTMIVLEPTDDKSWEALSSFSYWAATLDEDLFVAAHLTMTKDNNDIFISLVDRIVEAGVTAISLSENDISLSEELLNAREYIDDLNIELIWDLPVPYSELNPFTLEIERNAEEKIAEGAGKAWLYIEPDGDVLPQQGINQVLGNFLKDDWDTIWQKAKKAFNN